MTGNPGALPYNEAPASAKIIWGIRTDGQIVPVKVADDGTLAVGATVSSEVLAEATAAAPAYSEGQDAPLSQNLTGDLRVIAKQSMGATFTSAPVTVPATANGIQLLAANTGRKSATIYNPGSVAVYVAQTNAVTTGSGYIPPGTSLDIDDYSGAVFGIVATGTQVVSVMETST